jgi:hypothetical protein
VDDSFRDLLTEFLDGLTIEEHAALSDESAERVERLAQFVYVAAEERLNEFRAAHQEFLPPLDD